MGDGVQGHCVCRMERACVCRVSCLHALGACELYAQAVFGQEVCLRVAADCLHGGGGGGGVVHVRVCISLWGCELRVPTRCAGLQPVCKL